MEAPLEALGRRCFGTRASWAAQWPSILRWVKLKWIKHQSVDSVLQELFSLASGTSHYLAIDTGRCCIEVIDPLLVLTLQDSELEDIGYSRTPPPRATAFNRAQTKVLPVKEASIFFSCISWELLSLHIFSAIEILSGRPEDCSAGLVSAPVASSTTKYLHQPGRGGDLCRFLLPVLQHNGTACHACQRYATRDD